MNSSSKNETADLLIVGGGVAGSAVAISCASKLSRVTILHAGEDRAGVESLSPDACRRLREYSVMVGVPFSTVLAWWGSDRVSRSDYVGARVVQREELADCIRTQAQKSAEMLACTSIVAVTRHQGVWDVRYRTVAGTANTITARNICDATGRRSVIGRLLGSRRRNADHLFCVASRITSFEKVGVWTEAVSDGWWNLCSDGNCATVAFFSTPGILRNRVGDLNILLRQTKEMHRMVSVHPQTKCHVHTCGSSILTPCAGPFWFAVGDAAMTVQPLASTGTSKALRDATLAPGMVDRDGEEYDHRYRQEFYKYSQNLSYQYSLEARWPKSAFWENLRVQRSEPAILVH